MAAVAGWPGALHRHECAVQGLAHFLGIDNQGRNDVGLRVVVVVILSPKLSQVVLNMPDVLLLDLHRLVQEALVDLRYALEESDHGRKNLQSLVVLQI